MFLIWIIALMVHEWMTCQHWQVFSPYLAVLVIASLSPHPQYNIDFSLSVFNLDHSSNGPWVNDVPTLTSLFSLLGCISNCFSLSPPSVQYWFFSIWCNSCGCSVLFFSSVRVPSSFASDGKIRLLILHGNLFYTKIGNITDDPLQPNLLLLPKY